MKSFRKPSPRAVIISGAAGAAVLGAVTLGGAALAAGPSAMPVPSGSASAAPGAPAAPGTQGAAPTPRKHTPHIGGEVLTVSGSTVTVKDGDGFTRTITLGSGVTVTKDGAKSDVAAIVKGQHIDATGTVDSNGTTLDATAVSVGRPTPPDGGPGRGPHGPGNGRGPGGPGAPQGTAPQAPGAQQGTAPSAPNGTQSTAPQAPSTPPNGTAPSAPPSGSTAPSAPASGS